MVKLPPSRVLFVLPNIGLAAMVTTFFVILLTASISGFLERHNPLSFSFLLAAVIVSASMAIFAGGVALLFARFSQLPQFLIAVLIGLLHGYLYVTLADRVFALIVSTFSVPVLIPWMAGSSIGIVVGLTRSSAGTNNVFTVHRSDIFIAGGFLALLGSCGLVSVCLLAAVQLVWGGVTQHRVSNPTGTSMALVIRDDCGATCGCQMRVDLQAPGHYVAEVYRSWSACDAQAVWQSATELYVLDDDGHSEHIDIRALGFTP